MPRHVLLIGATGFLGRAIQHALEQQGHAVDGVGRATVDVRQADSVQKLRRLTRPGTVVIMAAAVTRDRDDSADAYDANVAMAAHVAQLLRDRMVGKCLYVSSDAVYGDHVTNMAIEETTAPAMLTRYAQAKLAGERLFEQAASHGTIPLTILRPCRVYGPGDSHMTYGPARFIRTALEQRRITLYGRGEERRDLLFIHDAARLVAAFVDGDHPGVYNLGTGRSVSFADVAAMIARYVPDPVTFTFEPRTRPISHLGSTLRKLHAACPAMRWTPLEEGLRVTVEAAVPVMSSGGTGWPK